MDGLLVGLLVLEHLVIAAGMLWLSVYSYRKGYAVAVQVMKVKAATKKGEGRKPGRPRKQVATES